MTEYILRLMILMPLMCAGIYGSLYLTKKIQSRSLKAGARDLAILSVLPVGQGAKLATVQFGPQVLLISIGKNGVACLAQQTETPKAFSHA
jgi:flagellar protein FliO/FliZ